MTLMWDAAAGDLPAVRDEGGPDLSVRVLSSFAEAEAAWRALEAEAPHSGYQRRAFVEAWQRHLGGGAPCIALIQDQAGIVQALLPLVVAREAGLGVARFAGGKHANLAMGLWRPAFAARLGAAGVGKVLKAVAAAAPMRIDLFRLTGQPYDWAGSANPLARLGGEPAPSDVYRLALLPDAEALMAKVSSPASRRKLRKKERLLSALGPLAFARAETPADAVAFIDAFLMQKRARCRELGIPDAFAEPGARGFLIEAATAGLAEGAPAVEVYALTLAGEPVAVFGGTPAQGRFSGMFNSIAGGPAREHSPGEILIARLICHLAARGFTVFDLGAGKAEYKTRLCDGVDALFDQVVPATWRGRVAAPLYRWAGRIKRGIKGSERAWALVEWARRKRAGR